MWTLTVIRMSQILNMWLQQLVTQGLHGGIATTQVATVIGQDKEIFLWQKSPCRFFNGSSAHRSCLLPSLRLSYTPLQAITAVIPGYDLDATAAFLNVQKMVKWLQRNQQQCTGSMVIWLVVFDTSFVSSICGMVDLTSIFLIGVVQPATSWGWLLSGATFGGSVATKL